MQFYSHFVSVVETQVYNAIILAACIRIIIHKEKYSLGKMAIYIT
jgi:hypothetical protein